MKTTCLIVATSLLAACTAAVIDTPRATTEVLAKSGVSWDGGSFEYPVGQPELTVTRIAIPAGVTLPVHCHPVPLAGVVTRGVLEVTKVSGESIRVGPGSGLVEVSNQWHHGHAMGDVEIIVVYAGAAGTPVTLLRGDDPELTAACR
jgi:quercetin dioxygenase-like cupin family protein